MAKSDHTVKSYDEELTSLHEDILRMGGIAESQFAAAMQAIAKRDPNIAAETVRGDTKIDELNHWVGDQLQRVYTPGG